MNLESDARLTPPPPTLSQPASSPFLAKISSATRDGKNLTLKEPTLVEGFVEAHLGEIPDGFDFQIVEKLSHKIFSSSGPTEQHICAFLNEVGKLVHGEIILVSVTYIQLREICMYRRGGRDLFLRSSILPGCPSSVEQLALEPQLRSSPRCSGHRKTRI